MDFDHVHFQVDPGTHWYRWFADKLQFRAENAVLSEQGQGASLSIMTQAGVQIRLSPLPSADASPPPMVDHEKKSLHGWGARSGGAQSPGVSDVAFRVPHLERAIARVLDAGGTLVQPVRWHSTQTETYKQATVSGWGRLHHTLIERCGKSSPDRASEPTCSTDNSDYLGFIPSETEGFCDPSNSSQSNSSQSKSIGWADERSTMGSQTTTAGSILPHPRHQRSTDHPLPLISAIDHVVLNVPKGEMESAVNWYVKAFGMAKQQQFSIHTERSALHSQVLRHPDGDVQFPINEPASPHSQIQEFLDAYGGAGIQHVALRTEHILEAIAHMRSQGVAFLDVPPTYYEQLQSRSEFSPELADWEAIARLKILVDWPTETPDALLLQTFTQPIFGQPTFFFEIIQRQFYQTPQGRRRVQGFGEGNFQALFEAVEREQIKRGQLM
ncbi:MAG: VOC family protein [Elainellaceae cyanobacterium]